VKEAVLALFSPPVKPAKRLMAGRQWGLKAPISRSQNHQTAEKIEV